MSDVIHFFSSSDSGAPSLTGEVGKLVDLLTACLVNGYATKSIASITRSGTTATVTTGSAHGLTTGQYARIAGADQSDYNGDFEVTVNTTTEFTYQVANSPTTPATGTMTARRAPAGWNLEYSGTNKAVYRSPNNASQRHCLRVLDDGSTTGAAKEAAVRGYCSMSDVDTGSEPFPTTAQAASGLYIPKSATANSTTRSWQLFANDKTFYLRIANGTTTCVYGFGHFNTRKAGDGYNTFIAAGATTNSVSRGDATTTMVMGGVSTNNDSYPTGYVGYVPRVTAQTGTASKIASYSMGISNSGNATSMHGSKATNGGNGLAEPSSQADGGLYIVPLLLLEIVSEQNNIIRGSLPGVYANACGQASVASGTTSTGIAELPGRSLYHIDTYGSSTGNTGQILVDLTGPW